MGGHDGHDVLHVSNFKWDGWEAVKFHYEHLFGPAEARQHDCHDAGFLEFVCCGRRGVWRWFLFGSNGSSGRGSCEWMLRM